jgi:hypothetical protein
MSRQHHLSKQISKVQPTGSESRQEETVVPALLQAFYAAHEAGDVSKAKELACEIAKRDPNIPSIKIYL